MNCLEYLELTYGADRPTDEARAALRNRQSSTPYRQPKGPDAWMG
jgi:hypothetical protein